MLALLLALLPFALGDASYNGTIRPYAAQNLCLSVKDNNFVHGQPLVV